MAPDWREPRDRLDQPRQPGRLPKRPQWDAETFAAFAERFARFLGTWKFIGYMTVFVVTWFVWNTVLPGDWRFDDYPFIFLTLMLSLQASYAAPLILLAQNRQADRDRVTYEQDRTRTERNIADTEYLTREIAAMRNSLGEVATRDFLRSELGRMLDDLDERDRRARAERATE
ncbi:hypothetical protein GCM10009547_05470 [Sporichthya brevicatena]|uniref:DUF1003 domain-containing protein n=1 Tax=Sporichthya brevicatena TaxID=171442 RepID=A0ABP3RAB9_9ACTN